MLSTGVKLSVDASDINVKFTKSIEQLNAGLTRSQKALGLCYDAQSRLNDALGRCVEGLSLYQQKLEMWVDEAGRARTMAGGCRRTHAYRIRARVLYWQTRAGCQ